MILKIGIFLVEMNKLKFNKDKCLTVGSKKAKQEHSKKKQYVFVWLSMCDTAIYSKKYIFVW